MIALSAVSYRYPGTQRDALHAIDLAVGEGELVGVVGANGAGKSTLCYALSGYIPHFFGGTVEGGVQVAGHDVTRTPVGELASDIGLVFHNPFNQISGARFTVLEEVAFGLENMGLPPEVMRTRAEAALAATGLADLAERSPFALSGGEQQRLAIAAVMAMQPRVLVFDEPTSQLDPAGTRAVFEVMRRLARPGGTTIVLTEHKLGWLAAFVDRLLVLHEGGLVADGPPRQVLASALDHAWGVGATMYARAAQEVLARGLLPPQPLLPATLDQAVETLR
ncbi:MAG: ABC transporter ATP-binding protein [Chloroflexi bacterium]|nr:ABC transporter ATP-binding protein [Chloroflexota bacterium]